VTALLIGAHALDKLDDAEARIDVLEKQVKWLQDRVSSLEAEVKALKPKPKSRQKLKLKNSKS
jgi:chaperonin cofactor prefoldin